VKNRGPDNEKELKMRFTSAAANKALDQPLNENARYVKHFVKDQALSQNQFDSLVSFVYNVGVKNAMPVLLLANSGELTKVPAEMKKFIKVKQARKDGGIVYVPSPGLVNRRNSEVIQFDQTAQAILPAKITLP
jgi:lysozyme